MCELADHLGVQLSGSLLAAPQDRRRHVAHRLAQAGHWVHADVIDGSYRGQPGLDGSELRQLADVAGVLDVHLMVDDPARAVAHLPVRPRRLTVQIEELEHAVSVVEIARRRAGEVWVAVEHLSPEDVEPLRALRPDGVLVMLTPPGRSGHGADIQRLDTARRVQAVPCTAGVDGGVDATNLALAAAAGVRYAVSGRALLAELGEPVQHGGDR